MEFLERELAKLNLHFNPDKTQWTRFGGIRGTSEFKLLGKKTKKKKWIKILGFWIKDNGMMELSKHLKQRKANGYKQERRIQHWTLNCIAKDVRSRKNVFNMRYKQKFY